MNGAPKMCWDRVLKNRRYQRAEAWSKLLVKFVWIVQDLSKHKNISRWRANLIYRSLSLRSHTLAARTLSLSPHNRPHNVGTEGPLGPK